MTELYVSDITCIRLGHEVHGMHRALSMPSVGVDSHHLSGHEQLVHRGKHHGLEFFISPEPALQVHPGAHQKFGR